MPAADLVRDAGEIYREQIEMAIDEFGGPDSSGARANIHGARKQLKRARATLRLLRDALGDDVFRRENISVRNAARPLSPIRDSEVLLAALDGAVERFEGAASSLPLAKLRNALKRHMVEFREASVDDKRLVQVRESLRRIERSAIRWRFGERDWSAIESGLKRTYREGRKAGVTAYAEPTTENLHEWRKQAKYLWHQLQVLELWSPSCVGELVGEMHALSDALGDDHDLAVLRARAPELFTELDESSVGALRALIDLRRAELQEKAFKLGGRLYSDRPKSFSRRYRPGTKRGGSLRKSREIAGAGGRDDADEHTKDHGPGANP